MPLGLLLKLLAVPELTTSSHYALEVLRKRHLFKEDQIDRALRLKNHARFQRWRTAIGSDALLVDGNCNDQTFDGVSPLSILGAGIAQELPPAAPGWQILVLNFFCGFHSSLETGFAGPAAIIRCLIAQLIKHLHQLRSMTDIDLSPIPRDEELFTDLRKRNIVALCNTFAGLIQRVPSHLSVYVVIDDVARYETRQRNWSREMVEVAERLQDVAVMCQHSGLSFKLLMTSTGRSCHVSRAMLPHNKISLYSM